MDTLVHDPFYVEVLEHFGMGLEQLFAIKDKAAWHAFERGELGEEDMRARYFTGGRALDLEGLRACMRAHYRWLPGVEPLLRALRAAGVPMFALSNYPVWYEWIEARLGLSRYLDWSFVSCRTGVRKPAPGAYLGAARALGVSPARCLFVDDREKNCAGARAVGMDAIAFTGADALRVSLRARGLAV
ncbi:MAG: HAD family phosphatase [Myxococcales bacterium]|nr:HAD family phosphatase [Myxococcales bacterium]